MVSFGCSVRAIVYPRSVYSSVFVNAKVTSFEVTVYKVGPFTGPFVVSLVDGSS